MDMYYVELLTESLYNRKTLVMNNRWINDLSNTFQRAMISSEWNFASWLVLPRAALLFIVALGCNKPIYFFFCFFPNNVKKLLIADGFNNLARACYKVNVSDARSDYFRISWQEMFTLHVNRYTFPWSNLKNV